MENVHEPFFCSHLHTGIMPGASSSVNTEQRRSRNYIPHTQLLIRTKKNAKGLLPDWPKIIKSLIK